MALSGTVSRSNWNLGMLVFVEGGKSEYPEKNPRSKDENRNKLHLYITPSLGIKPEPHWWEAKALTTAPSLLTRQSQFSYHAQSPFATVSLEDRREGEGGDTSSRQREVCVDDGTVLSHVIRSHKGRVEAGPIHPQKNGTCKPTQEKCTHKTHKNVLQGNVSKLTLVPELFFLFGYVRAAVNIRSWD